MRKKAAAALLVILLCGLTACSSKPVEEDIWTVVSEDTVELHEYTDIQFDDDGNVISKRDGFPVEITYEYDNNGLLTKKTSTNVMYGAATNTYEYDENGNVIASHCTFDDGDTLDMSYTYEKTGTRKYDANHIPVAEKYRHFRENYDK